MPVREVDVFIGLKAEIVSHMETHHPTESVNPDQLIEELLDYRDFAHLSHKTVLRALMSLCEEGDPKIRLTTGCEFQLINSTPSK